MRRRRNPRLELTIHHDTKACYTFLSDWLEKISVNPEIIPVENNQNGWEDNDQKVMARKLICTSPILSKKKPNNSVGLLKYLFRLYEKKRKWVRNNSNENFTRKKRLAVIGAD